MSKLEDLPELTQRPPSRQSSDVKEDEAPSPTTSASLHKEDEGVDVVVGLFAHGNGQEQEEGISSERSRYLRKKLDWNLLPLLLALYLIQFMDKNSIGATSILGIMEDNHLTPDQFNSLGTCFYAGYIIFVLPHAFLMQRFPIAKYIAVNIFLWSVFLGVQCACRSYGGLFACRFLLGASEGCITSGIMTIISMFYTRVEVAERIGWTFQCNGFAAIISGFVSFGVAHVDMQGHPRPWQWFMIIISISSFLLAVVFWWRFPDNPTTAVFLSDDEKRDVVLRIRVTQNGVESKKWKRYQFIEAFRDPKSYMFFLFAGVSNMVGGLGIVYQILLKGFGFTTLQSTILNVPGGFCLVISVTLGGILLRYFPNGRTLISAGAWCIAIAAGSAYLAIPLREKVALLVCYYLVQLNTTGFVMILSLCAVCTAGHTKKMTVNGIFLVGYALGQMVAPQFWKVKYRPKNVVPWSILLCAYVFDLTIVLIMRWYLSRENRRRDASGEVYPEYGYIEHVTEDGRTVKVKVPIQYMDITDWENRAFRYAL